LTKIYFNLFVNSSFEIYPSLSLSNEENIVLTYGFKVAYFNNFNVLAAVYAFKSFSVKLSCLLIGGKFLVCLYILA
jgi:hypothetical protein